MTKDTREPCHAHASVDARDDSALRQELSYPPQDTFSQGTSGTPRDNRKGKLWIRLQSNRTPSHYQGRLLKENKTTAVKVVFLKEDEIRETLLEMEILKLCQHPNITGFMGCYLKGLDFWICMEYCSGGALDSIYRGKSSETHKKLSKNHCWKIRLPQFSTIPSLYAFFYN